MTCKDEDSKTCGFKGTKKEQAFGCLASIPVCPRILYMSKTLYDPPPNKLSGEDNETRGTHIKYEEVTSFWVPRRTYKCTRIIYVPRRVLYG